MKIPENIKMKFYSVNVRWDVSNKLPGGADVLGPVWWATWSGVAWCLLSP